MTPRDPCTILIAGLMTVFVAVLALAVVIHPPKRTCKPGSLEQLFTTCEVTR